MDSVPWPTSSRAIVASFLENYVYMVELPYAETRYATVWWRKP